MSPGGCVSMVAVRTQLNVQERHCSREKVSSSSTRLLHAFFSCGPGSSLGAREVIEFMGGGCSRRGIFYCRHVCGIQFWSKVWLVRSGKMIHWKLLVEVKGILAISCLFRSVLFSSSKWPHARGRVSREIFFFISIFLAFWEEGEGGFLRTSFSRKVPFFLNINIHCACTCRYGIPSSMDLHRT